MDQTVLVMEAIDRLQEGVCVLDANQRVVATNRAFRHLLQLPRELTAPGVILEQLTRFRAERGDLGTGNPQQLVTHELEALAANAERRLQRRVGDSVLLEEVQSTLPQGGYLIALSNVTEEVRALQELIASDQHLGEIIAGVSVAIFVIDRQHRITHWNRACATLTGYGADQMIGTSEQWRAFYASERPVMADLIVEGASDQVRALHYGAKYRRSALLDGAYEAEDFFPDLGREGKCLFFTAAPLRNHAGDIVGAIETLQDVSERKRVSEELREAYQKLEQRVEDRTRELQSSNQQLEETLGELQTAQSFLIQSEKMASIGQLAAGVAHEINNPTGFVASNLNTLNEYVGDIGRLIAAHRALADRVQASGERVDSVTEALEALRRLEQDLDLEYLLGDIPSLVEESREGTHRIKKIVEALKDFAHPGQGTMDYADVNDLLDTTLKVVNNEIKYKAAVELALESLPRVKCLAQEINQVFVNLLVNAAQAIPDQGAIRISTRSVNDQWVEIKIADNGCGIPAENLKKIFDPFFTTKDVGKGTGLGLNVVYNIITKHQGTLDVESVVGKGTAFTLRLPIEPEAAAAAEISSTP